MARDGSTTGDVRPAIAGDPATGDRSSGDADASLEPALGPRSAARDPAPAVSGDSRPLAVLALVGAVGLAASQDAIVKSMSGGYPVHEMLFFRCIVSLPVILVILVAKGWLAGLLTRHVGRALMRALLLCTGYCSFTLAIAAMPMADVVAMYFTMPFFVAALAGPLLGERVPPHRWLAILGGFLGVLVMIRPGIGVTEPAAFLGLLSAAAYGLGQMMGRPLARRVEPMVMVFYQNLTYLTVAFVLAALFAHGEVAEGTHRSIAFLTRQWVWPHEGDWPYLLVLGLLATFSMILFTTAYRLAEASFVAPFEYTAMFWAVGYGLVLWGDVPGLYTVLGGGLVVGAGLFMLWRDRVPAPARKGAA
ncbi:MAG: DMT family transporter [Hyphomicrobiaceae bacterium]